MWKLRGSVHPFPGNIWTLGTVPIDGSLRSEEISFAVGPRNRLGDQKHLHKNGLQHFWLAVIKCYHPGVRRIRYSFSC